VGLIRELLSRSTADGSRTNALNHLQWMIVAFLLVLVLATRYGLPPPLIWLFAGILCVLLLCYLGTHFFFMVKNPDALRSEKFTIQKMAIERGLIGDSVLGMREVTRDLSGNVSLLESASEEQGQ